MLLRSSSTPILGSLLASSSCSSPHFSDSPNHGTGHNPFERAFSDVHNKLSFHHGGAPHRNHHHLNAAPFHAFSSPGTGAAGGFRRVQSDGNLQDLAAAEYHGDARRHNHPPLPMRSGSRPPSSLLESIPSFSSYSSTVRRDFGDALAEEEEGEGEEEEVDDKERIERSITIGDSIEGEFSFSGEKGINAAMKAGEPAPLFLARGLGLGIGDAASGLIVGFGGEAGGGAGGHPVVVDNGGDRSDIEAYYKKMVEEDPHNALFLRNYAQFLYQSKGDPERAEEYYSRAILAEPGDGEVLSQYAKLIWELHRDHKRASSYFERAVQAAPQDSHVLAAYAGFLWEAEDEEEDDTEAVQPPDYAAGQVPYGALASANVR